MSPGQSVYLSATNADLRSACDLLARELRAMKLSVVRAGDLGPVRDLSLIASSIARCDIFVQLVGSHYGDEPPPGATQFGRVSYGQFEALWAEKCGREVIYLLLDPAFPSDPAPPEAPELAQMQQWYRQHLINGRTVHHVSESEDLKSILQDPPPAARTSPQWLARAALIVLSLAAIAGSAAQLWMYYRPSPPAKPAAVIAPPAQAALHANSPTDKGKKKPGWHNVRGLLEIIADETAVPKIAHPKLQPGRDPIREAVARLTADRPDDREGYNQALIRYRRHVREQSSPAPYDLALVHFVALEFDQAASLSAEAALELAAERKRSLEPNSELKDNERKAWQLAGHTHMNLGQWKEAAACYTNANALDDSQLPHKKRMWLWTWLGLAKAFGQDFVGAETHFRDIVQHEEKRLPDGDLALARSIDTWAQSLAQVRRYEESATQARRALAMAEKAQAEPQLIGECYERLAEASMGLKRFTEAEPLLHRARLIWEEDPTAYTAKLVTNLQTTGSLFIFLQRPKDAEPVLRRALTLAQDNEEATHPRIGTILQLFGVMQLQNGNAAEAQAHLQDAVQILSDFHGPEHPETAMALTNLALALSMNGDLREAWLLSDRAVSIMRDYAETHGQTHPLSDKVMSFSGRMVQFFGTPVPPHPPKLNEAKAGSPTQDGIRVLPAPVSLPSSQPD